MMNTIEELTSNLDKSYAISASAGCGKTYALVARVISLLEKGISIKRMLLLTFSDNAAIEMKERIIEELKNHKETKWAITALKDIHYSSISTFHSFCLDICRNFPEEIGINHQVSLLDEFSKLKSQKRFFNDEFNVWGSEENKHNFLTCSYINGLSRKEWMKFFTQIYENLEFENIQNCPILDTDFKNYETSLELGFNQIRRCAKQVVNDYATISSVKLNKNQTTRYPLFVKLSEALVSSDNDLSTLQILKNKSKYIKTRKFDSAKKSFDIDSSIEKLGEATDQAMKNIADSTLRLGTRLLLMTAEKYRSECVAKGYLTFSDAILGAKKILQNEANNFEVWQKYDCIIVDEFQDTDPHQFEIISALSNNASEGDIGRLVVVGDHKQSIYGFRGVEVSRYKDFIATQNLSNLNLDISRRTTKNIITNVNEIMNHMIDDYDEMNSVREDFDYKGQPHFSTIGGGINASIADIRLKQGVDIANKIAELIGIDVFDKNIKQYRKSKYDDISILIRDRSGLRELIEGLSDKEIPFSVDSPALIFDNSFTKIVMTCLKAIAEPKNSISVIGALRSPLFMCSNTDLIDYIDFLKENNPIDKYFENYWVASLYEEIDFSKSNSNIQNVYASLQEIEKLYTQSQNQELVTFILEVILNSGIATSYSHFQNTSEVSDITKILISKAISFSNSTDTYSLIEFISQLEHERDSSRSNDKIILKNNCDAVHIMTAHSSKGLEFPIVIYVPSTKKSKPTKRSELFFVSDNTSINWHEKIALLHSNNFKDSRIDSIIEAKQISALDEESRITYVGLTRARDYLIIAKHHKISSKMVPVKSSAADLAAAIESSNLDIHDTNQKQDIEPNQLIHSRKYDLKKNSEHSSNLTFKIAELKIKIENNRTLSPGSGTETSDTIILKSKSPKNIILGPAIGRAVHRSLNLINFKDNTEKIKKICSNCAYSEGIFSNTLDVENCVFKALSTNTIKNLQNNFSREVPISGKIGNSKYSGYIDLLIENNDHYVIVDYKTDSINKKNTIESKVEKYSKQLATYSVLLKQNGIQKDIKAMFLFLDSSKDIEYEIADLSKIETAVSE